MIDHRDHDFKFVSDVYPAEKDKIEKVIEKSRAKIITLETSLATIESQEDFARNNFKEVSLQIDAFTNDCLQALEKNRQNLKNQLQKITRVQKHLHETQKESFAASLKTMKRSVELAEQALKKVDEVGVLSTRHEIIQQLTDTNSATSKIQARGMISCNLEVNLRLDDANIQKVAKITECDEEYILRMRTLSIGFLLMEKSVYASNDKAFTALVNRVRQFEIQSKNDNKPHWVEPVDDVHVNIKKTGSTHVDSRPIERNKFGLFTFSYRPSDVGKHEIEVLVNGRHLEGSPFTLEVKP